MSICDTKTTSAALQIPIGENCLPSYSLPHQLLLLLLLLPFLLLLQPCVFQFNFNFLLSIYLSLSLLLVRTLLLSVRSDATLHGCLLSVHTDVHMYVGVCMFVHMLIYVNVCKFMYMCLYVSMLFCLFIYVHASDTANYILLWAFIILEVGHCSPTHTYMCVPVCICAVCVCALVVCVSLVLFNYLFKCFFLTHTRTHSPRRCVCVCVFIVFLAFLICFLVGVKTVFCCFVVLF